MIVMPTVRGMPEVTAAVLDETAGSGGADGPGGMIESAADGAIGAAGVDSGGEWPARRTDVTDCGLTLRGASKRLSRLVFRF